MEQALLPVQNTNAGLSSTSHSNVNPADAMLKGDLLEALFTTGTGSRLYTWPTKEKDQKKREEKTFPITNKI